MFKNFFKGGNDLPKILLTIVVTTLTIGLFQWNEEWSFDTLVKEVNTTIVVLISLGIIPLTYFKKWKNKIDRDIKNVEKKRKEADKTLKKIKTHLEDDSKKKV